MKKLILSVIAAACALAAQAGNSQAAGTTPSCCAQMAAQTKAACPMAAKDCKACCPAGKATSARTACTRPVLKSPKAMG
jgi:hypothetical protein